MFDCKVDWNTADHRFKFILLLEGVDLKFYLVVDKVLIEASKSLDIRAKNFDAVVGDADGFSTVYPPTKLTPLRRKLDGGVSIWEVRWVWYPTSWGLHRTPLARRRWPESKINEWTDLSDSLYDPTTVLSEHIVSSSDDDELAWCLFFSLNGFNRKLRPTPARE
ncbi:hypothetical protein EVAR_28184_1 [Eumeta japonica]|uniref:Uncharacterized protein n=1 Tax=Eumeta variegata TaxID=151549 RepID=A0A4C1VIH1_EUMVA|nr:hypothetical protein EVAR_28184_1 [Eumeta japonica]